MNKTVLVVAPHADDESLGCGGSILKHHAKGDEVHWLIITTPKEQYGYSAAIAANRQQEIKNARKALHFSSISQLGLRPSGLETYPLGEIITPVHSVIKRLKPQVIYVPFRNDAHSDHQYVFDAVVSASKTFRSPYVKQLLAYETPSETDFDLKPESAGFRPNYYINITEYAEQKLKACLLYQGELGEFPFPRSPEVIQALWQIRGAQAGCKAAEAFMLLKQIND